MFKASSFADPVDVAKYDKWFVTYKDRGLSDVEAAGKARAKGDNGVGCWGDDTKEGSGPSCAVPPEYMIAQWGSTAKARKKQIRVTIGKQTETVILKDVMPHIRNIKNGARIDLNPDAVRLFGMEPPILVDASWEWVV